MKSIGFGAYDGYRSLGHFSHSNPTLFGEEKTPKETSVFSHPLFIFGLPVVIVGGFTWWMHKTGRLGPWADSFFDALGQG